MEVWAVVVAAGTGTRFGRPKQYEPLGTGRVVDRGLAAARATCDGVVLVVSVARASDREPLADAVVAGGATRSASVRAGLAAVPETATVVLVHDAARPLATTALFRSVIAAVGSGADAAVPVVAVADSLRLRDGGVIDRDGVVAVQTPQGFRAEALRDAHRGDPEATDDASLVEAAGGRVVLVDGEVDNRKITTAADLASMAALVKGP